MKIVKDFTPIGIYIETEEERGALKEILMLYCNEEENNHFKYGMAYTRLFTLAHKITEGIK